MKVFKCVFTGDEVLSDGMKNVHELEDGLLVACDSYNIVPGQEDYGIENNDEEGGGGGGAAAAEQVNVVVGAFNLQAVPMGKKDFQLYVKQYLKRVKAHLEQHNSERVQPFMEGMKAWVPKMLKEFDEYEFYMGPSCDPDALLVMAKYEGEAPYPSFLYIKDGMVEEKF